MMQSLETILRNAGYGVKVISEGKEAEKPPEMQPKPAPLRDKMIVRRVLKGGKDGK